MSQLIMPILKIMKVMQLVIEGAPESVHLTTC